MLAAAGAFDAALVRDLVVIGELGLDGRVHPVTGVLPAVIGAVRRGYLRVVVPRANAGEAGLVPGAEVIAVGSLAELCARLRGEPVEVDDDLAAAGHGVRTRRPTSPTWSGSPTRGARWRSRPQAATTCSSPGRRGSARRCSPSGCPGCCPTSRRTQALEVTSIHSLLGRLPAGRPLVTRPPFCAPHHTATVASLIGGGTGIPAPGTISLAHHGVLVHR